MTSLLSVLVFILFAATNAAEASIFSDESRDYCAYLSVNLIEERGFMNLDIENGWIQQTGRATYTGIGSFYYPIRSRLRWDENLRACAVRSWFNVYGCNYQAIDYVAQKLNSDEWVYGHIQPAGITPSSCSYRGKNEQRWTLIPN